MRNLIKFGIVGLAIIIVSFVTMGYSRLDYSNPQDNWVDLVLSLNQSGNNITADNFFGNLTGTANNSEYLDNIDSTQFLRSDINDTLEAYVLHPNGTNPLSLNHLVNKEFVELAVAGLSLDYFFTNATSDISGYFVLNETERSAIESVIQSVSLSSGTNQSVFNFSTETGLPFIFLSGGIYDAHIHLDKTGGAAQTIVPRWALNKRNVSGEFLIMTSETSNIEITDTKQIFDLHAVFNEDIPINNLDRLVLSIFVDIIGGGSSTVRLYMEGTTDSHFTFRTPSSVLQEIFIRRDGTNQLTGNWNVGDFNLTNIGNVDASTLLVHNPPVECPSGSFMTYTNMTTSICVAESGGGGGTDASAWNWANNDSLVLDNDTIIRTSNTTWRDEAAVAGGDTDTLDIVNQTMLGTALSSLDNITLVQLFAFFNTNITSNNASVNTYINSLDHSADTTTDTDLLAIVNVSMFDNLTIIRDHNTTWVLQMMDNTTINRSIDLGNYNYSLDLSNYFIQLDIFNHIEKNITSSNTSMKAYVDSNPFSWITATVSTLTNYFTIATTFTHMENNITSNNASLVNHYAPLDSPTFTTAFTATGLVDIGDIGVDAVSDSELDGGFSWTLDSDLNINSNTLFVDQSASFVGIGTATPSKKLHIAGSLMIDNDLYLGGEIFQINATSLNINETITLTDTSAVEQVVINASGVSWFNGGNVGVGTTSPTSELHVVGDVNITGKLIVNNSEILPRGMISAFYVATCPDGWILADGTSSTPDLRGIFVRGAGTSGAYNMSNGTRYSATYGEFQNDSFQQHWHNLQMEATGQSGVNLWGTDGITSAFGTRVTDPITAGAEYGAPRMGAESAPASFALIYCMKT